MRVHARHAKPRYTTQRHAMPHCTYLAKYCATVLLMKQKQQETASVHHACVYITNMYIYGNTQLQPHAINGNSNLPQARNDNAMRRRSANGSKNKWAASWTKKNK